MTSAPPFALTEPVRALVNNALETGSPMLLAAVDHNQQPLLSFRGSTAVFSDSQLSVWARNSEGGTISAIKQNPRVAMIYRSPTTPVVQFAGRGRVSDDAAECDRAFNLAPERERTADPQRKGCAIIIDLDVVRGVLGFENGAPVFVNIIRAAE